MAKFIAKLKFHAEDEMMANGEWHTIQVCDLPYTDKLRRWFAADFSRMLQTPSAWAGYETMTFRTEGTHCLTVTVHGNHARTQRVTFRIYDEADYIRE
jgi:hypothetical protein